MIDLDQLSRSDLLDLMADCSKSTRTIAKVFFPERFVNEFSPPHEEIFEAIDSGERRIVIAEPRGTGKTSIISLALVARKLLFQLSHFIAYITQSASSAELQMENLKRELLTNQLVRKLFGSVKADKIDGMEETFSKRAWVGQVGDNNFKTLVYPRGSGQQIRGVLFGNYRPDLLIFDDLEEAETIRSDDVRKKREDWFDADALGSIASDDKADYQIVYIDTLKHEDSILAHLLESPGWLKLRHELCDDEFNSNFPTFKSRDSIISLHSYYKEKGQLDVFYREYRNIPISKEDATFKPEYFRNYSEVELGSSAEIRQIRTVILCDPAKTAKLHSDDSAIVVVGVSLKDHKIYVRDVISGKFYPEEFYNKALDAVKHYNAHTLAVEVTSLHEFIVQPFKNQMRVRGIFPQFVELKAKGKKEDRIASLAPYYKQGYIHHAENCCSKLENQLLGFPRSRNDDCMDALAYLVEFLEMDQHYFDPVDFDPEGEPEEFYSEIDNDKAMKDWRVF